MELTRTRNQWDPLEVLTGLESDLNRVFGRQAFSNGLAGAFEPPMEVWEEDNHYVVHADLPGVSKEDLNITVERNRLTLKGERKRQAEKKEKGCHYSERAYGSFSRSFEFPVEIDASKIKAAVKEGVLEITLPKAESSKPRQIKID